MGQAALKVESGLDRRTPVDRVIAVFGAKRAAQMVDLTTEALRKWKQRGGLVPSRYQKTYLDAAEAEGLALAATDFIAEPRR